MPSGDREFVERREADKNPEQAKFTTKHGSQGVTNPAFAKYTQSYQDLQSDYQKNWAGKGVSPTEYGAMHYASYGKNEGRSLSGPKPVARHVSTSTRTSAPAPTPAAIPSTVSKQKIASLAPVVETPVVEAFDMAKLTDNMDLSNKLTEIVNTNSPLFKAATTKAMQNMQRIGLVNSSLAHEAVMNAVINVAMPIAQAEVNQLVTNLYYNTDWTNKQKTQANEAAYNKMLTQVQGSLNFTLQQLTGSQDIGLQHLKGAQSMDLQTLIGQQGSSMQQDKLKAETWAKYGDWVTTMATSPGADQQAWQNMLDTLTGAGGWPKPS
tara:strand:+ start:64 stop:1029 length:966 start_codon:yes stop_codon:yes gene_type:complete